MQMVAISSSHRDIHQHAMLDQNRLHLHHGPIDLVIQAWGETSAVAHARTVAKSRFAMILDELVSELSDLRSPWHRDMHLQSPVAKRMQAAVAPFGTDVFVTPMAAVAGAVADEILGVMVECTRLDKAFVNNGGDIAVYTARGETLTIGLIDDPNPRQDRILSTGQARISSRDNVGGIATSGRSGRSFSQGIADAVTVIAKNAAAADVAATLIANAVDTSSDAIIRVPATDLDPDSDLGSRLVTTDIGDLTDREIHTALSSGHTKAEDYCSRGLIDAALLRLRGQSLATGSYQSLLFNPLKSETNE